MCLGLPLWGQANFQGNTSRGLLPQQGVLRRVWLGGAAAPAAPWVLGGPIIWLSKMQ
jgi:hypothetical protein